MSLFKLKKEPKGKKEPNSYESSNGERFTQSQIDLRRNASHQLILRAKGPSPLCEACEEAPAVDPDHTIAQARCKEIHKTELIWDVKNQPVSCRQCHHAWESTYGLAWIDHKNVVSRLQYLHEHDIEGFKIRIYLTDAIDVIKIKEIMKEHFPQENEPTI